MKQDFFLFVSIYHTCAKGTISITYAIVICLALSEYARQQEAALYQNNYSILFT